MLYLHALILCVLCLSLLGLGVNLIVLRSLRAVSVTKSHGRVSILVPARDEERSIGECVDSLLEPRHLCNVLGDRHAPLIMQARSRDGRSVNLRFQENEVHAMGWNQECCREAAKSKVTLALPPGRIRWPVAPPLPFHPRSHREYPAPNPDRQCQEMPDRMQHASHPRSPHSYRKNHPDQVN